MGVAEKVIYDIEYIIKKLIEHLKATNSVGLLLDNNVDGVKDKLYSLYAFDYRLMRYMADIVNSEIHPHHKDNVDKELKKFIEALKYAEKHCYDAVAKEIFSKPTRKGGWFYTGVKDRWKYSSAVGGRIYLNCKTRSIPNVVMHIIDKTKEELEMEVKCLGCGKKQAGIVCSCNTFLRKAYPLSFKFSDPSTIDKNDFFEILRPDKMVIYIHPSKFVVKKMTSWFEEIETSFYTQVPLFSTKLIDGVGYAPEPTIEQQDGFRKAGGIGKTSFGGLVTYLIANIICSWCHGEQAIPNKKTITNLAEWTYKEIFRNRYKIEFSLGMKD